jgi:cation diffusion facilitator family transporter
MNGPQHDQVPQRLAAVRIALLLNILMAGVGTGLGIYGRSLGILADALDMAADGAGYGLAWLAQDRPRLRRVAARWIGGALVLLGLVILAEAVHRWFGGGEPLGPVMMGYSLVSFSVNLYVLVRLARVRHGGVHLNASYLCTRADVLANVALFISGGVVWFTHWHWFDLLAAIIIAAVVFHESWEIFEQTRESEKGKS